MAAKKPSRADYLGSVSAPQEPLEPKEPQATPKATRKRPDQAKTKRTLYIDPDLIARCHGAIATAAYRGRDSPSSLSDLVSAALENELARLVDELQPEGGEFPALNRGIPKGRPPKG